MELFRLCLFILLSLSVTSTTNSDHTNAEEQEWKGGEGVKRSRVRRQNLHIDALRLQEKVYALYVLWRLLNEVSNNIETRTSTKRPDKLESMTSEGSKNTEIVFKAKDKPSSALTQEQSTQSTGITGTDDSHTAMASFPIDPSQKTTQSGDSRLVQQSTQRLQTTVHKITEPSEVTEQHKFDSTTFKTVEEPSLDIIFEESTPSTGTNDSTAMSFPTELPPQVSQKNTQSAAPRLLTQQITQNTQRSKQKILKPSQVTDQPDSTTLAIKMSFKAAEELSSTIIHERLDHFTGITDTKDSTAMAYFPSHSQKTTQSRDSLLVEQSTMAKQKMPEPIHVREQHIPDSTTLTIKMSSKAAEELSSTIIHEQMDHFTGITDTKVSTAMAYFPTHSPDSQKTTQSEDSLLVEQSTMAKQKITEPSKVTEQHISRSKSFKISPKAAEEPSSDIIHEESTRSTGTNDSTGIMSFPTELPPQESQINTQSGASRLFTQKSTQHTQRFKEKFSEPSQATEQHIPDSTTLTTKMSSKAAEETSSTLIQEQIDNFNGITHTKDSTAMPYFSTHPPDSQKTTQSEDSLLVEQSTMAKQKIIEPIQFTEQHIPDSTTLTIKMSSKAAEELFSTIIHEQMDHFTGITDTKVSKAMAYFPTHSPDSQKTTQSEDSLLVEQSTMAKQKIIEPSQVTEQHISRSKTLQISSEAAEEPSSDIIHEESTRSTGTNDSTGIMSFPTELPPQESQINTQSGASRLFTQQSTQHIQRFKEEISEPSQNTEQHIPDSTTLTIKMSSKAVEETSSTLIQEQIDNFTGITHTKDSTAMPYFSTHPPDSQKTTQSEDSLLVEQSTMAKQKIIEPSQVTEQHISHSKTLQISSEAAEEPSSDIIHEESTRSTGTNDSTGIMSFPTELPPQESQKNTQSEAPLFTPQSFQHIQHSKEEFSERSQVTDQDIPNSTTLTIKATSKAADKPSSTIIQEQIDHFTGITAMASFPTHSQKTTQSGDAQIVEQSKKKITEPSQVTEQHNPHSKTFTIKNLSKAVEEHSSITIHDQISRFIGMTDTTDTTATMPFHFLTELPPQETQKITQSGATRLLAQQSTQNTQRSKQKISKPSQVTDQHIPDSTTLAIKMTSKAAEEFSSTIIHERLDHFTGITDTKDSTAMAYFPSHSQKTTQSRDSLLVEQSTMAKQKMTQPIQVREQHIPDSTTLTIKMSSKAAEELSSTIIHEQMDHFTGITDTKVSTAMAYFPTHSPDSQKTTQSEDSLLVEQSTMAKQKITEPSKVTEQHISRSKSFKISPKAAEEPSSDIIHEESTRSTGTNDSTGIMSFPTELPPQESQINTQSGASRLFTQQSTQHTQHFKEKISEPSQATEQHIPDSTTLTIKMSSKAVEETSSTLIQEQIDNFTGITHTKDSTAMPHFSTHSPDSQKTTQSEDSLLVEQSTMAKQKMIEPIQFTEQHIPDSTTLTIKMSSKAAEELFSTIIHEQMDHFTGITDTKVSTAMAYFPTHSPDSQKTTQSEDSLLVEQSTMAKQKINEPSQVTEQHISRSKTLQISSEAAEELSSDIIHEESTRSTGTNDSTGIMSFPTELPPEESQINTQSGASRLFTQQSTQHIQRFEEEISEPSQNTEQHIPDSTTLTIKMSSKAVEETSSTLIQEQIDNFTGITHTKDSTAMPYFSTHPPDSQKTTQSEDSLLVEQSTMAKQKIIEPSQVTEQHISHSKTLHISSEAAEEPSSDIIHEESTRSTGTNDSTGIMSFPTELPPQESQKNTQSEAPLFTPQSFQHIQHSKEEFSERSQVTDQDIPNSTTLTIKATSKAADKPSSTIIQEQIDHFTGITAMASFPTHSQKTTQSGDAQIVEQSKKKITEPSQVTEQHNPHSKTFTIKNLSKAVEEHSSITIHDQIARFTGMTGATDTTAMPFHFPTELPPQETQKNTQSGTTRLLKQPTQHFQSPKSQKPSQEILQTTALMSIPVIATAYKNEKETLLQTTINSNISNHSIPASARGNNSLQPTSLPQTMKHEHPRRDITGMVKGISKPILPTRTKNPTSSSSAVKLEILETATYTHSLTRENGKPKLFVTATDRKVVKKNMPSAFTLKQQIQDSTSLLLTEESPISHLNGFTSDPEHHKPTPAEEPTNQHTEQNANNTAKSSRESLMQHIMTTKTRILTNESSVSRKTASTSPLPSLTEASLVDSEGPGGTSVLTGISLHVSTSSATPFRTDQNHQMNPKTQSESTTNKYPIHGTKMSHTSVLLVKDTSTQAPTDRVQLSQTIPVSTEKLLVTSAPNSKPLEKDTHTTSVMRRGFLTLRTQEIPFRISTKRSNLHPIETTQPQSDLMNQEQTADTVAEENYTNNDLLTDMDKPTQSTIWRKLSKTTRTAETKLSKTQNVSQNRKKSHKSSNTALKDDMQTGRGNFGLLFSLGCLILLIITILLWAVWRSWQAWHWRNNIWVAGPPLLYGTYHSVLQSSSPHAIIKMTKGNTQTNKQENHDVDESIPLKQQQKDLHKTQGCQETQQGPMSNTYPQLF